jgi:general secretion pathway protein K
VLAAISILTVLLAELQDEASSESAAAIADRDALKAEYAARSAVNLSRLLIATEPTIRTALAPILMMALGGSTQIPVWEFANQMLGAFNDKTGANDFASLSGFDIGGGRNLGMSGARFEVSVVDEDSKINLNVAARGDAITQNRIGMELLGLMAGDQYNQLFENRDPDGQFSDRMAICSALVDWADSDENMYTCDPRNAQAQATTAEDTFYQMLRSPYRRKNAAYDSLEELHLVRGVSEDFFATFVDPDPSNPKKRTLTVWGQGAINVNNANAQTLLSVVCGFAVANPPQPLCTDPEQQARFLMAVNMLRSFYLGCPPVLVAPRLRPSDEGRGPPGPHPQGYGRDHARGVLFRRRGPEGDLHREQDVQHLRRRDRPGLPPHDPGPDPRGRRLPERAPAGLRLRGYPHGRGQRVRGGAPRDASRWLHDRSRGHPEHRPLRGDPRGRRRRGDPRGTRPQPRGYHHLLPYRVIGSRRRHGNLSGNRHRTGRWYGRSSSESLTES